MYWSLWHSSATAYQIFMSNFQDLVVDLPDNYVDLLDLYVDLSLTQLLTKFNTKTFPSPICAIQLPLYFLTNRMTITYIVGIYQLKQNKSNNAPI